MYKYLYTLVIFLLMSCNQNTISTNTDEEPNPNITSQSECDFSSPIYDEFSGDVLFDLVKFCYTPTTTYSYQEARVFLYSDIDVIDGKVQCIYTGYEVEILPLTGESFISAATEVGVNTEHVYPQSRGAGEGVARTDLYHIYPAKGNVNSARSNKVFDDIVDEDATRWYFSNQSSNTIPISNIDLWSESNFNSWEPREDIKGDVARSIFYFRLIHSATADQDFFNQMVETLLIWNSQDPVDQREMNRNNKVKELQGNDNPFIIDPTLATRIFG